MSNPIKVSMTLEAEKKYSIKYIATDPAAAMQSAYINRKELPDSIPSDIVITIDFVDWAYILGHMVENKNRKNR